MLPETKTQFLAHHIHRDLLGTVSTANITAADGKLLVDPNIAIPQLFLRNDTVGLFRVERRPKEIKNVLKSMEEIGFSPEFRAIYALAHQEQIDYLRFCPEGDRLPESRFPHFNW